MVFWVDAFVRDGVWGVVDCIIGVVGLHWSMDLFGSIISIRFF
jgi:hypothetical protein